MSDTYLRNNRELLLNAIGSEQCWGWSPAIDIVDLIAKTRGGDCNTRVPLPPPQQFAEPPHAASELLPLDEFDAMLAAATTADTSHETGEKAVADSDLHVLLVGSGDVRHVVQTVCKLHRHQPKGTLHLYLYEPNLRTHCRHLLLLQMLFDKISMEELEDRTAMFLEAFGNTLVRDITALHIKAAANRSVRVIGYNEGYLSNFFDFSAMKTKERDFVEGQLAQWTSDSSRFDISPQWDHRLRTEMAERYDNRVNIIDWDFHMNLMEHTHLIKFPEYREWRLTGIAFDYARINPRKGFTYDYKVPNKSLALFNRAGQGMYYGDVKCGPFYALGCDTENTHILQRGIEGTVKFGNGVIAMHNVRAWLYELATKKPWPWSEHQFAWDDPAFYNFLPDDAPRTEELTPPLPNVVVHHLGIDWERFLLHFQESGRRLDAAFFGCGCVQLADARLLGLLRDDGIVACETLKFILDASDEAKDSFVERIRELLGASQWCLDPALTAYAHERQPPPKARTVAPTPAQTRADQRLQKTHILLFRKKNPLASI